jgi:hypothetical protein
LSYSFLHDSCERALNTVSTSMSMLIARKTTPRINTIVDLRLHPIPDRSILCTKHAPLATASTIVKAPKRTTPIFSNVLHPLEPRHRAL